MALDASMHSPGGTAAGKTIESVVSHRAVGQTKGNGMPETDAAIETEGLQKHFGKTRALRGLDLRVDTGTVFGLLGPNDAGKTTAVRILTTLPRPDAGRAWVAGLNVVHQANRVRAMIGIDRAERRGRRVCNGIRKSRDVWAPVPSARIRSSPPSKAVVGAL
ncbi:MAG: hypothetical protein NVS2B16_35620 [Chloroflexota bacterium]